MDSIWDLANSHLRDLGLYEPGKPIEETARECGLRVEEIVKLASNENPLGPSAPVRAAMQSAIGDANFYPDGGGFYLCQALAQKLEVAPENIILGNGSNEIIEFIGHSFLRSGTEMLTSENAFVADSRSPRTTIRIIDANGGYPSASRWGSSFSANVARSWFTAATIAGASGERVCTSTRPPFGPRPVRPATCVTS